MSIKKKASLRNMGEIYDSGESQRDEREDRKKLKQKHKWHKLSLCRPGSSAGTGSGAGRSLASILLSFTQVCQCVWPSTYRKWKDDSTVERINGC